MSIVLPSIVKAGIVSVGVINNNGDSVIDLPIEFGEGWEQITEGIYEYNSLGGVLYPELAFVGLTAGVEYRVLGECTILTTNTSGPKITVRLGNHPTPDMFNILSVGSFDKTAVAGSDHNKLVFIANDSNSVLRCVLKNLRLIKVPVKENFIFNLTVGELGDNTNFGFQGVRGAILPTELCSGAITYLGSFGENWMRVTVPQIGAVTNLHMTMLGESKTLTWDGASYSGSWPVSIWDTLSPLISNSVNVQFNVTGGCP